MKLTNILLRQHIGWHFNKFWQYQSKRKVVDKGVVKSLEARGLPLYTPEDILNENQKVFAVEEDLPDYLSKPVVFDETHPDWHSRPCYTYKDNNVLVEGLNQAKALTKTVGIQDGLPQKYNYDNVPVGVDKRVKQIILSAHVFDTEQQKLSVIKDPLRPAWNFPRTYGITDSRVNQITFTKLLQLIEFMSDINLVGERNVLHNVHCSYPFEKGEDLIQLQLRSDILLTSINRLSPITSDGAEAIELPNIFPIKCNISLNKENIYNIRNIYPIKTNRAKSHPHTLFVQYNTTEVKNIYEAEVTDDQVLGRTLLKSFCTAAAYAKLQFGDVKVLPEPVTVQCVQSDGRLFDFGVFQLNTLDLNETTGIKNIWYHTPRIPLFTSCCYNLGKPVLEGYNNSVIKHLFTFYNSI